MRRRLTAAALAVAALVGVAVALQLDGQPRHVPPVTSAESARPGVSPAAATSPPSPPPSSRPRAPVHRPPAGTLQIGQRYLATYRASRVTWDEVLDRGRPLPRMSTGCADRWAASGKDRRLDWEQADFLCLDALGMRGYRPQGVGGSATTQGYRLGGRPAAQRNLVVTSWYSRSHQPSLFPRRGATSVTQLVVMDLDRRRYNSVELARPDGPDRLRNLNSHGSGLVWAGQYLYSSSRSALWMFNADDLLQIRGRYVLPAVTRWSVRGRGGLSSISLDRSTTPDRLTAINYSRYGQAYIQSFDLGRDGRLAPARARAAHDLRLRNEFGERGRLVHSARSLAIPGTSYQGVASVGRHSLANSSGMRMRPGVRGIDATAVFKDGELVDQFQMPFGNGESVYVDYRRGTYTSITERHGQFLFTIPLGHLLASGQR